MQLQENIEAFNAAGIGVVAMTYDSVELLVSFAEKFGISYPLLSDVDAQTMIALDILNTEYSPGDGAYGIPHPGVFVVDPDGTIVGKVFLEGYTHRVSAQGVLDYANSLLN